MKTIAPAVVFLFIDGMAREYCRLYFAAVISYTVLCSRLKSHFNMLRNISLAITALVAAFTFTACNNPASPTDANGGDSATTNDPRAEAPKPVLDTADYQARMMQIANGDTTGNWPVKDDAIPLPGALLPYHRIIAYYGNLYSTRMGILGEIPKEQMFKKLLGEVDAWAAADSTVKTIPALHYIAVTAQGQPGKGGKHRLRMPFHQIDTIVRWAKEIDAITFVDVQVGHATVQEEIPELEPYLKTPTMHLGIDPEFSMKDGSRPGAKIGTFDAADINWVVDYLARIVRENNIPPKILVIHRFTQGMITNYQNIKKVPEVQIVIDMDGFGDKPLKMSTFNRFIRPEPIQFVGFKLFYKNDTKANPNGLFHLKN